MGRENQWPGKVKSKKKKTIIIKKKGGGVVGGIYPEDQKRDNLQVLEETRKGRKQSENESFIWWRGRGWFEGELLLKLAGGPVPLQRVRA